MMCLLTVRQITPGSFDDFRAAWHPDPWPPQLQRIEVLRNDNDPDEVTTIGYVDMTPAELDEMRDTPEVMEEESKRLERIAPFEEKLIVNAIYELVEEVRAP